MWWGAIFARDEINRAGGITVGNVKRPIELVRVDSNEMLSVPDAASAAERAILRDRVNFLVGGLRTEAVLAMQEVMADHKIMFLGVGAAHPELTARVGANYDRFKYFFRVSPFSAVHLGTVIFAQAREVQAALRAIGVTRPRVAFVGEAAVWVDGIAAAAARVLPGMGMDLVGTWRPSAMASDMTAELSAIRAAGAHMIITTFTGPVGTVFARQWNELQVPAAVTGINTDAQGGRFWQATGGRGEYMATMATLGRIPLSPSTIPWYDAFLRRHGEVALFTAAGAHNSLVLIKEAIERAGTISVDAVIEEMKKTDFAGLGGVLVFDANHDIRFGPGYVQGVGLQWIDGHPEVFWPAGFGGTIKYTLPPWVVNHWRR